MRCRPQFSSLDISFPPGAADGVRIGASVAINGTCLTVGQRSHQCAMVSCCATDVNVERADLERRDPDPSVAEPSPCLDRIHANQSVSCSLWSLSAC